MSMPGARWGGRPAIWLGVALVGVALLQIAIFTRFNAHPDEGMHADAFCYFEDAWWPPDLNDPTLIYSPGGISRVYNGEAVYLLLGHSAAVARPALAPLIAAAQPRLAPAQVIENARRTFFPLVGAAPVICNPFVYRILNVGLYLVTVGSLLAVRHSPPWPARIALLMLCVPQVVYLYAYANSDAWGLSVGIWLFVFALTQRRLLLRSWPRLLALGLLIGLVLLAKEPFWMVLPFSLIIVLAALRERLTEGVALRSLAIRLTALALVVLVVIAPLKLIYPLSQPDYRAGITAMREERARDDFKPSNPTNPGYLLASKGVPFQQVAADPSWYYRSAISFYGFFGYFTVPSPGWAYLAAALVGALSLLATLATVARGWGQTPPLERLIFATAPLWIALSVLASLYNSWTFDMQPQGRYLFSALIPLAILLGGPIGAAPPWQRRLGGLCWALMLGITLFILWSVVLPHPSLQPNL